MCLFDKSEGRKVGTCHDEEHVPVEIAGSTGCATCHGNAGMLLGRGCEFLYNWLPCYFNVLVKAPFLQTKYLRNTLLQQKLIFEKSQDWQPLIRNESEVSQAQMKSVGNLKPLSPRLIVSWWKTTGIPRSHSTLCTINSAELKASPAKARLAYPYLKGIATTSSHLCLSKRKQTLNYFVQMLTGFPS